MNNTSIRDYGIIPGRMKTGARNAITDVPGVRVGHCTLDDERHKTGVTVILPCEDNIYLRKMAAADFVVNGFGKTLGLMQLDELGTLETPIALTSTTNVGKVHEALVEYTLQGCRAQGAEVGTVNPIVGETNDVALNDVTERAVGTPEVLDAIRTAGRDFAQGDVGAGKGTTCFGFKGGIGTASRVLKLGGKSYTVGALVQSNFGATADFIPGGLPLGPILADLMKKKPPEITPAVEDKGSIMMILATDLPLNSRQLHRLCKRATVGLARTGSFIGHCSGDVVIAFSTANRFEEGERSATVTMEVLAENQLLQPLYAAAECVEEAILNSLTHADRVCGKGRLRPGLGEYLPEALKIYRADEAARIISPGFLT